MKVCLATSAPTMYMVVNVFLRIIGGQVMWNIYIYINLWIHFYVDEIKLKGTRNICFLAAFLVTVK